MSMDSMKKYRLAVDENGSPFVLNSKGSIDFGLSGGVFRIQYSRNKKKVYSVPAVRMPEPVSQAKVPAPENNQQASSEASGDSL